MEEDVTVDEMFDYYISTGVLIPMDEQDGEVHYKMSVDAETRAPELYKLFMRRIEDDMIELVDKGLAEVSFSDSGEPLYSLTPKGTFLAKSLIGE